MKNIIYFLVVFLITRSLSAQKTVGIHLLNYQNNEDLVNLSYYLDSLANKGINTIFLEIDYHFDFKSHPELIQTDNPVTKSGAKKFAATCKDYGIKIIPQFQCLGHQSWAENTWKLLTEYPELDLTPGAFPRNDSIYCREWDVMNPKVNKIVFPLIDEIIEAFDADGIHIGMDEVFLLGHNKSPSTRGMNPAILYAKVVNEFYDYFTTKKGKQIYMWGDRLIDASKYGYGSFEASTNSTHSAIDSISKDIIICDWHYNVQKRYPSVDLFLEKGFSVLPCSWKNTEAAETFIRYSFAKQDSNMLGHMFTTWGAVDKNNILQFGSLNKGVSIIKGGKFHEVLITQHGVDEEGNLLVKLATINTLVSIRYTLDGTTPTIESELYKGVFPYLKGKQLKTVAFKDGEIVGNIAVKYFTVHKGIGKSIEMITMPSDQYAAKQRGGILLNGVDLTSSYNDGEWLGFEGNDCEFIIDMGRVSDYKKVTINFNNQVNNLIHHPQEVIILGSKNGKSFDVVGQLKKRKTGRRIVTFSIPILGEMRYIKVIARNQIISAGFNGEGSPAWIFLDEVVVE
tara:strand:- start:1515 stop:3215 length:1701 start_codon:yes stop_codon:yes gene_type:complete